MSIPLQNPPPLSFRDILVSPVRALRTGKIVLASYHIVTLGSTAVIAYFCGVYLRQLMYTELTIGVSAKLIAAEIVTIIPWLLALPLLLAFSALPVRHIWFHCELIPMPLLKETASACHIALHAYRVSARRLLTILLFPVSLLVLWSIAHSSVAPHQPNEWLIPTIIFLGIVGLPLLIRQFITVLITLTVPITIHLTPAQANEIGRDLPLKRTLQFSFVLMILFMGIALIANLRYPFFVIPPIADRLLALLGIAIIWSGLQMLSVLSLEAPEELVRRNDRTFRF